jgi:hypothetical protein
MVWIGCSWFSGSLFILDVMKARELLDQLTDCQPF